MIAIIGKEWKRLLRLPSTPWVAMGYVLLPLAVTALYLRAMSAAQGIMPQMMPMFGAQAMATVATWQLLLLGLISPWVAASLLAEEAEGRTLDAVLVTGPGMLGVVLGKLLAAILFLAFIAVAGLPVYILAFVVGGINWVMMGRVLALMGATIVMMAGLGLAVSAFGRKAGTAALAGLLLGLMLTVGSGLAVNSAGGIYGGEAAIMAMKMGMPMPQQSAAIPKWLYANPLVGLNTALNQGGGLFGLPGAGSGPVYRWYRLWQLQAVGSVAVALVGLLAAWGVMWARLRWRVPLWLYPKRKRSAKEVPVNG